MTAVQPQLWVDRAAAAIEFYRAAFGAEVAHRVGDGEDVVAQLTIGDAAFWIAATTPGAGGNVGGEIWASQSRFLSSARCLVPIDPAVFGQKTAPVTRKRILAAGARRGDRKCRCPRITSGTDTERGRMTMRIDSTQPLGTPTWIDLGIPDPDRAMAFYGAVFGWDFEVGPEETGRYTMCRVDDRAVAAIMPNPDRGVTDFWWSVYLATDDCAETGKRVEQAGGRLVQPTMDVMDQGRMAIAVDPVGAQFGLWEGRSFVGAELVNEPGSLLRNDLVTSTPGPAREFYATVFDFTLDSNPDLPGLDFTFLRRPDGHEIGGIMGNPSASSSRWGTLFEVADTDAAVASARASGGTATDPQDFVYGRVASITDPFGATFDVGARLPGQQG
jgi:uncharacterized protein